MHVKSAEASVAQASSVSFSVTRPSESSKAGETSPKETGSFSRLLNRLGGEIDRGESIVQGAANGRSASADPSQLIALQAGIYRYVEAVDLASKLVDRATNGIKTVLQSQ